MAKNLHWTYSGHVPGSLLAASSCDEAEQRRQEEYLGIVAGFED
jgi:hypothetical protein